MSDEREERRVYWANWYWMNGDDAIVMRGSIWNSDGHAQTFFEISASNESHAFWLWLFDQPEYCRILNEQDVAEARDRFELETNLR